MSTQNEDKWLDELISKSIDTTKPQFDAEQWKKKYSREFQILLLRADRGVSTHQPSVWRTVFRRPISNFSAAAVLVMGLAIGAFMGRDTWQSPGAQSDGKPQMAQVEPTSIYNLDYLTDMPKGSLADTYLTLAFETNGRER